MAKTTKHTPGPWKVSDAPLSSAYWVTRDSSSGKYIATVEREADARLIASAPEMHDALRVALARVTREETSTVSEATRDALRGIAKNLRAAIAKATEGK